MTDLVQMLPYVVTVLVLIAVSMRKKKEDQPPHLGLPYFREERLKHCMQRGACCQAPLSVAGRG